MKLKSITTIGMLSALALFAAGSVGCERESQAEQTVEDAGDAIEDAADEVGDAIEDATD